MQSTSVSPWHGWICPAGYPCLAYFPLHTNVASSSYYIHSACKGYMNQMNPSNPWRKKEENCPIAKRAAIATVPTDSFPTAHFPLPEFPSEQQYSRGKWLIRWEWGVSRRSRYASTVQSRLFKHKTYRVILAGAEERGEMGGGVECQHTSIKFVTSLCRRPIARAGPMPSKTCLPGGRGRPDSRCLDRRKPQTSELPMQCIAKCYDVDQRKEFAVQTRR